MKPRLSVVRPAFLLVAMTGIAGMTGLTGCLPASPTAPAGSGGKSGGSGGATNGSGGATSGSGGAASGGNTNTGSGGASGGSSSSGGAGSGGNTNTGSGGASGGSMGSGGRADGGVADGPRPDATASGGASPSGSGGNGSGGNASGGAMGSGGAPVMCTPPTGGSQGFTTRFWDCCKPSCAWTQNTGGKTPAKTCNKQNQPVGSANQSACSGGDAHACWDMAPWAVSDTKAFAFAAFNGGGCGTCYELKFTGQSNSNNNDPGAKTMCGKTLIVQVVNIGGIQGGQFDIMIPGGGVGDFNACSSQWGVQGNALGERYGGVMLTCQKANNELEVRKACTLDGCSKLFSAGNLSMLKAGCDWTVNWLNTADNPKVVYSQIACPNELTSKSGLR